MPFIMSDSWQYVFSVLMNFVHCHTRLRALHSFSAHQNVSACCFGSRHNQIPIHSNASLSGNSYTPPLPTPFFPPRFNGIPPASDNMGQTCAEETTSDQRLPAGDVTTDHVLES